MFIVEINTLIDALCYKMNMYETTRGLYPPETNSKSPWKWIIGRRSGFLLGRLGVFSGALVVVRFGLA